MVKKVFLTVLLSLIVLSALSAEPAWREISTKHFTFIYQPEGKTAALKLASFAEEVYQQVTGYFGYRPKHVLAVVRTTSDFANGFFAFGPRRLNLFVAPPTTTLISAYSSDYLRNLLVHEFTHFVHLSQPQGVGAWRWLLGPDAPAYNELFLPGWAVEGITTNTEGMFASGGRARNPFFEMEYKAPLLEHHMWTYDQAAYGSLLHPYDRWYPSGFMMVDYLREHWGEKAFNTIYLKDVNDPWAIFWGYNRALEAYTHLSCTAFFQAAQKFMLKKFASDATFTPGSLVSPAGQGDWYLPYTTARGFVGYAVPEASAPGLYLENLQGQPPQLLLPVTLSDPYSFGVSADGKTFLVSSPITTNQTSEPEADTSKFTLWLAHNGGLKRLSPATGLYSPQLSPDGQTWWAFQRRGTQQVLVKGDLSGHFKVIYQAKNHLLQTLAVSPDGQSLVFVDNLRGQQGLTITDANGKVKEHLNTGAALYFPRWVSQTQLTVSTDQAGRLDLWLVDVPHHTWQRLPRDPVGDASGILVNNSLLYQTYTWQGWALKQYKNLSLPASQPLPLVADQPSPPPVKASPVLESHPWCDLPLPYLWIPFPFPSVTASGQTWTVGAGALLEGTSPLETQSWQLIGLYVPQQNQLVAGNFTYSWRAPGWQGTVSTSRTLLQPTTNEMFDAADLVASVPWGEWDSPQLLNRSTLQAAVVTTSDHTSTWATNNVLTQAAFQWGQANPNAAINQPYGSWGWSERAVAQWTLPVWSQNILKTDVFNTLQAGVPVGPMLFLGRLKTTVDSLGSLILMTPSYSPSPLNTQGTASDWRTDAQLEITWPFGFADLNLLGLGVPLQGLSAWADAGAQGQWQASPSFDQGLTYGVEFNTVLIIGQIHLPFTVGVAAQAESGVGGFLNPQVYVGVTPDSFVAGLAPAPRAH